MVQLPPERLQLVGDEFAQPYFDSLIQQLKDRKAAGEVIYPAGTDIFRAFRSTPVDQVRVVILGQDPYHGLGQAHGLSFSVPDGVRIPPSLKNIYHEIITELGGSMPTTGNLTHRTQQGVLLLNAILTVKADTPASHREIGREKFTDTVIHKISEERAGVVFLLRGNFARSKKQLIDTTKHLVLEAPHPSPFSAHSGFFGCDHFKTANAWLEEKGQETIIWLH